MFTLNLTEAQRALAPIIVSSPTARCGTTLVQRLLTSSDNAFIYGEEVGLHVRHMSGWLLTALVHIEQHGDRFSREFQNALDGEQADWRPGLPPPPQILMQAYLDTFLQAPVSLQAYGGEIKRPLWGFKCPGLTPETLRLLFTLMPQTKVVYVVRRLTDALRSAKARRFVTTEAEAEAFCIAWRDNLSGVIAQADGQQIHFMVYEDLCARPQEAMASLEGFTGAHDIKAREFDIKVNTFEGDAADGRSPSQYIEPTDLSDEEERMAQACAEPVEALLTRRASEA